MRKHDKAIEPVNMDTPTAGDEFATSFEDAPGVRYSYDFVLPSYDWAIRRLDAVNDRIQSLLMFASGLTIGVPTLAKAAVPDISFGSFWFILGVVVFVGLFLFGVWARNAGSLALVDPIVLADEFFWDDEFTFKKDMVYFAGNHFDKNVEQIGDKAGWLNVVSVLFLAEMLCLVLWLALA